MFKDASESLEFLRFAKTDLLKADSESGTILHGRDKVLERFGPLFRNHAMDLTEDDISAFLDFEKNCHWTGLHRQKSAICSDINAVRRAVAKLVKRQEPDNIATRFDYAYREVTGFGEGIITPILFVAYPDYYGVWNSKSEFALQLLNLWTPNADRGESKGSKYTRFNAAIYHARKRLNELQESNQPPVDLWTIDYYWHAIKIMHDDGSLTALVDRFQRERH